MASRRILIVYGTKYGQTGKIARFMADVFAESHDSVMLVDARVLPGSSQLPRGLTPRDFDGVIVGASVLNGRHQRCVEHFARAHREELDAAPSAFFSVSGSAGDRSDAQRVAARRYVDEFVARTGWRPLLTECVAGAIAYRKYNPLLRWIMRRIAAKEGRPTDTTRDHELTDWAQVRRFVEAFAASAPPMHEKPRLATV